MSKKRNFDDRFNKSISKNTSDNVEKNSSDPILKKTKQKHSNPVDWVVKLFCDLMRILIGLLSGIIRSTLGLESPKENKNNTPHFDRLKEQINNKIKEAAKHIELKDTPVPGLMDDDELETEEYKLEQRQKEEKLKNVFWSKNSSANPKSMEDLKKFIRDSQTRDIEKTINEAKKIFEQNKSEAKKHQESIKKYHKKNSNLKGGTSYTSENSWEEDDSEDL